MPPPEDEAAVVLITRNRDVAQILARHTFAVDARSFKLARAMHAIENLLAMCLPHRP